MILINNPCPFSGLADLRKVRRSYRPSLDSSGNERDGEEEEEEEDEAEPKVKEHYSLCTREADFEANGHSCFFDIYRQLLTTSCPVFEAGPFLPRS